MSPLGLIFVAASATQAAAAWSVPPPELRPSARRASASADGGVLPPHPPEEGRAVPASVSAPEVGGGGGRRDALSRAAELCLSPLLLPASAATLPRRAGAYTPDGDPVRESLYFVSRVQEATVQQERFVRRATDRAALRGKMMLTLRLVEKNYRLLDQVNSLSAYVEPPDAVVEATEAGFAAAEALQAAIDYVKRDLGTGPMGDEQRSYLTENLTECREELFKFLKYMPQQKLREARERVEVENVQNREEYDGDGTEGVYNPVVLPWKDRP